MLRSLGRLLQWRIVLGILSQESQGEQKLSVLTPVVWGCSVCRRDTERETMAVVGASSLCLLTLCSFLSLFLPGDSFGERLVFAFTRARLYPSAMSTVNQLGQQVLMRCTTDHTAWQLFTRCCVRAHGCWPQTRSELQVLHSILPYYASSPFWPRRNSSSCRHLLSPPLPFCPAFPYLTSSSPVRFLNFLSPCSLPLLCTRWGSSFPSSVIYLWRTGAFSWPHALRCCKWHAFWVFYLFIFCEEVN